MLYGEYRVSLDAIHLRAKPDVTSVIYIVYLKCTWMPVWRLEAEASSYDGYTTS